MFKILVWDYTGVSAQWLEQFADLKYIDVVATMTPQEPVSEFLLKKDAWDWLLIFEKGARQFFDATIQLLQLPSDKVIYALDMVSWMQHSKAAYTLINPDTGGYGIFVNLNFMFNRKLNDFITCTVDGLSYIGTSNDACIMFGMYTRRDNWAAKEMQRFHALAKKYYNVDDSAGYFLDLGANIGTTSIYFIKKLAPNLKLLAFEPDAENFKLLRANLILNDIGDYKVTAVNCGLGDKFDEVTMYRNLYNPGANSIFQCEDDMPKETITTIPLDAYLAESKISAREVKYIWLDTEGFEAQVLLGAKNLLAENPAPLFMECNLGAWKKSGYFDALMDLLSKSYSHFILFAEGKETLYPIDDLRTFAPSPENLGQLGDIFLIRSDAYID